jgi:hypothetical protein
LDFGEDVAFTHGGKHLNFSKKSFDGGFGEENEDGFNFVDEGDSDVDNEVLY